MASKQRFSRPDFTISFEKLDRFTITPEIVEKCKGNLKEAVMAGIIYEAQRMAGRNGCRAGEFFLETSVERIYERANLKGGGHNSYSGPFKAAVAGAFGEYVRGHGAVIPVLFDTSVPKGSLVVKLSHCEALGIKGALVIAAIGLGYSHKDYSGPVVYSNSYIHNRLMGLMGRNAMENTLRELEEAGAVKDIREKFSKVYRVWNLLPPKKLENLCKGICNKRAEVLENIMPNNKVRREVSADVEKSQRGLRRGVLSMSEYTEQRMLDVIENTAANSKIMTDDFIDSSPIETYAALGREELRDDAARSIMKTMVKNGVPVEEMHERLHKALAEADRMFSTRIGYKARIAARAYKTAGRVRRFIGAGNATVKRMRDSLLPWGARGLAERRALVRC